MAVACSWLAWIATWTGAIFLSAPLMGAPAKRWQTYPMPPRVKASDPMRLFPGIEVPEMPERFNWQLKAPSAQPNLSSVPVYSFSDNGRKHQIGTLPLGTPVTLDQFRSHSKTHYYAVPFTAPSGNATMGWVSGVYIAPVGYASAQ